jgi:hypothetical protein
MLADELDYVIGVDTHRDEHALAVVAAPVGAVVAGTELCGRKPSRDIPEDARTSQLSGLS